MQEQVAADFQRIGLDVGPFHISRDRTWASSQINSGGSATQFSLVEFKEPQTPGIHLLVTCPDLSKVSDVLQLVHDGASASTFTGNKTCKWLLGESDSCTVSAQQVEKSRDSDGDSVKSQQTDDTSGTDSDDDDVWMEIKCPSCKHLIEINMSEVMDAY